MIKKAYHFLKTYFIIPLSVFFFFKTILKTYLKVTGVIFNNKAKEYNGYGAFGLGMYFYKYENLLLQRFGRSGTVSYFANGNFKTSKLFWLPRLSLNLFSKAPSVFVFLLLNFLLLSNLVWADEKNTAWIIIVILSGFSSLAFICQFKFQNYNMMGWAFFPLLFFFAYRGNWLMVGIISFVISLGSPTAVFALNFMLFCQSLYLSSLVPLLAVIPANIALLTQFGYPFDFRKIRENIYNTMRIVGSVKQGVKYKRSGIKLVFTKNNVFELFYYLQFGFFVCWLVKPLFVFYVSIFILFFINRFVSRFADIQSFVILFFSFGLSVCIYSGSWIMLLSFIYMINPLPTLLGMVYREYKKIFIVPNKTEPLHVKPIEDSLDVFFSPVQPGKRVFVCYGDPHDTYEQLFDSTYIFVNEISTYCCVKKEVLYFPNYFSVFENNYPGAPGYWGREVAEVKSNIALWKADYVIVYQEKEQNNVLDPKWEQSGFTPVSYFNWFSYKKQLLGFDYFSEAYMAHWWLLKPNT